MPSLHSPKVSILIPAWNRAHIIEETLESALAQTVDDLEVVVVDNASTDGTWEVIQKVAARDGRVRPVRNETNIGPVRNWRRMVDEARGDYGKILWSDDLIAPDFLECTLPVLRNPEVGFVWTGFGLFSEDSARPFDFYGQPQKDDSSAAYIRQLLDLQLMAQPPSSSPGCALFRMEDLRSGVHAEIPNRIGSDFSMHGIGNDVLVFLLTAARYPRVAYVPKYLSSFRAHAGSITIGTRAEKTLLMYRVAKAAFVSGPGRDLLTAREIARFNAASEVMRLRHGGRRYGLRSWRDFYPPGMDEGTMDWPYLLRRWPRALWREQWSLRAIDGGRVVRA